METENWGVFINTDYRITETWTLTAGLRYSDETKDVSIIEETPGSFCPDTTAFNCTFVDRTGDWDNWTPKLGAQWQFSDNSQAYAFWTKGFRAGGFNFRNAKPGPIPPFGYPAGPTQQEEQNSYEIGLKTQVFDDRLRMNLAYFRNDIDNVQRELNQGDPDVIVLQATINAGDARIEGVEFEFNAVPVDALTVYGSLGYLDGKYTRINPLYTGINPIGGAPYIGEELPRLAPWSFSLGGSYDFFLEGNGILRLQTDFGYRDPNFYDDANTQLFDRQHRLSGSINWISPEERWTVTMFGRNLRDEANYGNLTSIAGLYTAGPMQKGREYGLQVQYRN
jgi:iron complex outermembrane receptor protein